MNEKEGLWVTVDSRELRLRPLESSLWRFDVSVILCVKYFNLLVGNYNFSFFFTV